MSELAPFLALALFGALHCAGMCGGFALVAARAGGGRARTRAAGLALYALGKALAYAALGTAVALAAHAASLELARRGIGGAGRALAVAAGASLAVLGLAQAGVRLPAPGLARAAARTLEPAWRAARALPPAARSFGTGFLTGFLPCGLSWSALALATQSDPATAAAGLFAFGVATTPALAAVGLAQLAAPPALARRARLLVGPALIALGILTAARGGPPWAADALPACCREVRAGAAPPTPAGVGAPERVRTGAGGARAEDPGL